MDNKEFEEEPKEKKSCCKRCKWYHWLLRGIIGIILIALLVYAIVDRKRITAVYKVFIEFLGKHPYLGPILVICAYIISTTMMMPGFILTFGTGFAFSNAYSSLWLANLLGSIAVDRRSIRVNSGIAIR